MSVSSEVQRTLVKSPPELWAELSDPAALARHLGELGEIRIVRTEPDRAVDWEATAADDGVQTSGRVEIRPSGWGTRVTLSASRAIAEPEPEPQAHTDKPHTEPQPQAHTDKPHTEPQPQAHTDKPHTEPEPQAGFGPVAEAIETLPEAPGVEPESEIVKPQSRRGFFARLFAGRKNRTSRERAPVVEAEPEPLMTAEISEPSAVEVSPAKTMPRAAAPGEGAIEEAAEEPAAVAPTPEPDISAELAELEEQTTAVLTAVLDRLGAAHHRPFSRA